METVATGLKCPNCGAKIDVRRKTYQYTCPNCGALVSWSEKEAIAFREQDARGCIYGLTTLVVGPLFAGPVSRLIFHNSGWVVTTLFAVLLFFLFNWALMKLYVSFWK